MIIDCILLAISVSIDALSLGITYGIKNAKITKSGNTIIFTIAFVSTSIAIILGHYISILFSPNIATILGASILIFLGLYTIYKSFTGTQSDFDFDNSNYIDKKEAIFLALAVSIDASCVGLSCGIMGINSLLYPFLAALFHMFFINCGTIISSNIIKKKKKKKKVLSSISGLILITIGFLRILI